MIEQYHNLYRYTYVHRVIVNTVPSCQRRNMPMHKKPVKIHKGMDNEVYFRAIDNANAPYDLCHCEITARVYNNKTKEQILDLPCRVLSKVGGIQLSVNEADLVAVPPGLYSMVLVCFDHTFHTNVPFYSDFDENVEFTLEITEQAQREPIESKVVEDWSMLQVDGKDSYVSSAIPSSRVTNTLHNLHNFSVYSDNYTGTLEVFATLNMTPDPDLAVGWVQIPILGLDEDYIQFNNFSGTRLFTFEGNYMWIKLRYTPDDGDIQKIIVRS